MNFGAYGQPTFQPMPQIGYDSFDDILDHQRQIIKNESTGGKVARYAIGSVWGAGFGLFVTWLINKHPKADISYKVGAGAGAAVNVVSRMAFDSQLMATAVNGLLGR